jgi:hypothetical protein
MCRSDCRSSVLRFLTAYYSLFTCYIDSEPMEADAQRQKRRANVLSSLNVAIEALNLAKEVSSITPAKVVFGSVSIIITMIRVGFFLHRMC